MKRVDAPFLSSNEREHILSAARCNPPQLVSHHGYLEVTIEAMGSILPRKRQRTFESFMPRLRSNESRAVKKRKKTLWSSTGEWCQPLGPLG